MRGYTFLENDPAQLKVDINKIKPDFKIVNCNTRETESVYNSEVSAQLPISFDFALPRPCPEHPSSAALALLKRVATRPPPCAPILAASLKRFTEEFCKRHLNPLTDDEVDFDEWLAQINQPEARKQQIKAAWEKDPSEDPAIVYASTEVKSFIKDEPSSDMSSFKAPRGINARCDWFKAFCGPHFDEIGKKVFKMPWFIKTVPVLERPEDIINHLYSLVGKVKNCDASSFEAHFIAMIMESIEFVLYRYMCAGSPALRRRCEEIIAVLKGKQILKFKHLTAVIDATRMSGEMNTSLGNGFTTLILNLFLAWIKLNNVDLRCEGDDNLANWAIPELAPTDRDWVELGWIMKVEDPANVFEASFCGNVFDELEMVVVTDPRTALANLGWTNKKYVRASESLKLQLLRSKGLSMAHQYNGCPLLGDFGRRIVELTAHVRIRRTVIDCMDQYSRMKYLSLASSSLPPRLPPGMGTRLLVEKLYNIPVADQISFEEGCLGVELYTELHFPFIVPNLWYDTFEDYTHPVGAEWESPRPHDHLRLRRFIASFGATTRGYMMGHYGSVT